MAARGFVQSLSQHGNVQRPVKSAWRKFLHSVTKASRPTIWGIRIDDLGQMTGLTLSTMFILSNLVVFIVILSLNISKGRENKYVALKRPPASVALCDEVPELVKGEFTADIDGNWDTSEKFSANRSLLILKFGGEGMTTSEYQDAMQRFWVQMKERGAIGQTRSCRYTLTTWASLNLRDAKTDLQLSSNTDAGIIFDGWLAAAALSSGKGVCTGSEYNKISGHIDRESKEVVMSFPIMKYQNGSTYSVCPGQLTSGILNGVFRGPNLNVKMGFDLRATALVVGLNAGAINSTKDLITRTSASAHKLGLIGYIDPLYSNPPMKPIYCIDKSRIFEVYNIALSPAQIAGPEICFLAYSFGYFRIIYFYPSMIQVKFVFASDKHEAAKNAFTKTAIVDQWMVKGVPKAQFVRYENCRCPRDQQNVYCNQGLFFLSYFYDVEDFSLANTVKMAVKVQMSGFEGSSTTVPQTNSRGRSGRIRDPLLYTIIGAESSGGGER